jgi:VIT1/CCC1 family predicted Fe2+/Mn2+ transporter
VILTLKNLTKNIDRCRIRTHTYLIRSRDIFLKNSWICSESIFTTKSYLLASNFQVISVSFGGLMAIFSGYLGSNEKNLHLNICMIFMASAFLSGLILMLLSYMSSTRSRIGITVSILGYYAISLLVFGLFSVFIVEIIQLI